MVRKCHTVTLTENEASYSILDYRLIVACKVQNIIRYRYTAVHASNHKTLATPTLLLDIRIAKHEPLLQFVLHPIHLTSYDAE